MNKLRNIIDLILRNILSIYFIAIVVVIVLYARSCAAQPEKVQAANYEVWYTVFEEDVVEEEPVLNLSDPQDVAVENLGQVVFLEDIPLSKDMQEYIFETCDSYDISPYFVLAIIERESNFKSSVKGDNGESIGLMQIKEKYQKERMQRLGVKSLLDAKGNVLVGIDYLSELFANYEDVAYVLHTYNGGAAYASRLSKKGITSKYASAILTRAEELERSAYE